MSEPNPSLETIDKYLATDDFDCQWTKQRLIEWRRMTGNRRVKVGAIGKIASPDLFDEDTCSIINVSHIYGVVTHQEEYHKPSSLSDYAINWAVQHLPLSECKDTWEWLLGIDETLCEVVKYKEEDDGCVDYPIEDYFNRKDGHWVVNKYITKYDA